MIIEDAIKIIENIPNREADCRCGNISLTAEESRAIKVVVEYVTNSIADAEAQKFFPEND